MSSRRRRRTPKADTVRGRAALRLVGSDRREMSTHENRESVCSRCAAYTQDVWVAGQWRTVDDVPMGGPAWELGVLLGTIAIPWENGHRHGQAPRVVSQHDLLGDLSGFGFYRIHQCRGTR